MADFKVIETQEQFDTAIKERIERAEKNAEKRVREEFAEWSSPDALKNINAKHSEEIKALNEKYSKELEKYSGYDEKFKEQESKIHDLEIGALKTRIASEKGLSFDAVEFLHGDNEESIRSSADKLANLSGRSHAFGFTKNTEEKPGDPKEEAFREIARRFGKN